MRRPIPREHLDGRDRLSDSAPLYGCMIAGGGILAVFAILHSVERCSGKPHSFCHSALRSAGTSPNFLITLASLKSPVAGSPVRLNATAPT